MKKIVQITLIGMMIVPMTLNAHDTKSIIGWMILIALVAMLLPICFALVESLYTEIFKHLLNKSEKVAGM